MKISIITPVAQVIGWNSPADTGISRVAANTIGFGNGTAADISGKLQSASLALGGATIGSNALAVTGTTLLTGNTTITGNAIVSGFIYPSGSANSLIASSAPNTINFEGNNAADLFLTIPSTGTWQFGKIDGQNVAAQTLKFQSANTLNNVGVNSTIIGSLSCGSGASGDIILQTGGTGASSGVQNTPITALTIKGGTTATLAGSIILGSAAIATTATDGFLYIATCAGAPTGVPTSVTGRVALVWDTTNHKFWVYDGAWKGGTNPGAWT